MRDRQTCIGCGKKSPETETNYTLISAQFGWRLTRYKNAEGAIVIEWRCPSCWREYKKAKGGEATSTPTPDARQTPEPPSGPERASRPSYHDIPRPSPRPAAPGDSVPPPSTGRPRTR
jgi:hypothetical protein